MASVASVLAGIGIVVTGGVVRVTGSGLGCTEWPMCTAETLAPTAEMGLHGVIEFSNRMLTSVICVIVGWVIIAARLQSKPSRAVLRGAWAQFWIVVLNAVVGGITVWMRLSPYVVAAHLLAAMMLLATAVITWDRVRREQAAGPHQPAPLPQRCRTASTLLLVVTSLLVVVGTLVTGSGPHAGDSSDVQRMPFNWVFVTTLHGVLGAAALALIGYLLATLPKNHPGPARKRAGILLAIVLAQGLIGLVQSVTGLPELVVILHLLGAALTWAGTVRLHLATRLPVPAPTPAGGGNPGSGTASLSGQGAQADLGRKPSASLR